MAKQLESEEAYLTKKRVSGSDTINHQDANEMLRDRDCKVLNPFSCHSLFFL
jgi:hypothetical protein